MASLLTTTLIAQTAGDLEKQIARFAPTDLRADISALPANERQALAHMVRAAQVMDALFLEQVWAGNEAMLSDCCRRDRRSARRGCTIS